MSDHPIVHVEISAKDRKASAKFYEDVFGWKMTDIPEMNYTTFEYEDGRGGGLNPVTDDYPAGTVMVYIQTDDIEKSLEKITLHGGKLLLQKKEIPSMGWYAFFEDPGGNQLALYKGMQQAE
jgi:predicted enzyme related to lactoylglutathione lyase